MKVVRIIGLLCSFAFVLMLVAGDAGAVSLRLANSFRYSDPEGLAFDPASGHLFVARGNEWIEEITVTGEQINRFHLDRYHHLGIDIDCINGLDILPNGNLAISSQSGSDSGVFEFTTSGNLVRQGGFLESFDTQPPSADADGVAYHAGRQTVLLADDVDERIYEFNLDGRLVGSYRTEEINSRFDSPEGITVDPLTGNIFVVDADEGTERLYELQLPDLNSGDSLTMVASFDLKELTNSRWDDPEGVTIDALNRILYVAWDNDNRIAAFNMGGGRVEPGPEIPEPSTMLLLGSGLLAIRSRKRRRR